MFSFIRVEIRPTLAVTAFCGAIAPMFFTSILTIATSICFCVASALLFISFVIIPQCAKNKYRGLILQHYREPRGYYQNDLLKIQANAQQWIAFLYGVAGFLYVIGLVYFVINH